VWELASFSQFGKCGLMNSTSIVALFTGWPSLGWPPWRACRPSSSPPAPRLAGASAPASHQHAPPQEKAEAGGCCAGKSTAGWRSPKGDFFPDKAGPLRMRIQPSFRGNGEARRRRYHQPRALFQFRVDSRLRTTPGCNSGIRFSSSPPGPDHRQGTGRPRLRHRPGIPSPPWRTSAIPTAQVGPRRRPQARRAYDLVPAGPNSQPQSGGGMEPRADVSRGRHVEHWLNGEKF